MQCSSFDPNKIIPIQLDQMPKIKTQYVLDYILSHQWCQTFLKEILCQYVRTIEFREWAVDGRSESAGQQHHSMPCEATLFMWVMDNADNNYRATIVKEIAHIHFTVLTELQLGGNRIESVEGLVRVHLAHLKYVFLSISIDSIGNNNITSVGVIRKAAWPDLKWLSISMKWIIQIITTSGMPKTWCTAASPRCKGFGHMKRG